MSELFGTCNSGHNSMSISRRRVCTFHSMAIICQTQQWPASLAFNSTPPIISFPIISLTSINECQTIHCYDSSDPQFLPFTHNLVHLLIPIIPHWSMPPLHRFPVRLTPSSILATVTTCSHSLEPISPPYGIDIRTSGGRPTGRFTNGRTIADIVG